METQVSEILENILSLLSLEGSFDVEERQEGVFVSIETDEAGKLIGQQGQTLAALQLIVNQIVSKKIEDSKRVIIDIGNWRKSKEEELAHQARSWAERVIVDKQALDLQPMPAWQRRVIHMVLQETPGVKSESTGEGLDRHIVISPTDDNNDSKIAKSDEEAV